ncbi:MAG: hypothetical protein QOF36_2598 [Microbacteriaceae bacterium]|jgi:hypothetical protein|nr:hypothetical protein [Microbacteriaceae bacterium]
MAVSRSKPHCPFCNGWQAVRRRRPDSGVLGLAPCPRCTSRLPRGFAATGLAAMDFDSTDSPSVDQAFPDGNYRWPDPGEVCLDVLATVQLYWPRTGPPQ